MILFGDIAWHETITYLFGAELISVCIGWFICIFAFAFEKQYIDARNSIWHDPTVYALRIFVLWNSLCLAVSGASYTCWTFLSDRYDAAHLRLHVVVPLFKLGVCVYAIFLPKGFWRTYGILFAVFSMFQVFPSIVAALYAWRHARLWLPDASTYEPILKQRRLQKGKQRASNAMDNEVEPGIVAQAFMSQRVGAQLLDQNQQTDECCREHTSIENLIEELGESELHWVRENDDASRSLQDMQQDSAETSFLGRRYKNVGHGTFEVSEEEMHFENRTYAWAPDRLRRNAFSAGSSFLYCVMFAITLLLGFSVTICAALIPLQESRSHLSDETYISLGRKWMLLSGYVLPWLEMVLYGLFVLAVSRHLSQRQHTAFVYIMLILTGLWCVAIACAWQYKGPQDLQTMPAVSAYWGLSAFEISTHIVLMLLLGLHLWVRRHPSDSDIKIRIAPAVGAAIR